MQTIRWGILGCGKIARKFAADLQLVKGCELIAIGSRSKENADKFAGEFPVKTRHYSYEALIADKEVDVIYIASPHGLHHEHTLLCLHHHKAVLCEKAFALNTSQATEMIELARLQKVFLMEALWTKFMPHYQLLMRWLRDGKLGDIQNVLINFGFAPASPVPRRMFDPLLGGGSLLDIGIYNVFMALSVLGKPDFIDAWMTPASTGVDEQCSIIFRYKNGAIANLFSSFSTNLATEAHISGRAGRIRLTNRFYEPSTTIEYYPDKIDSKEIIPYDKEPGWGYQYEIKHVNECLSKGLTESPVMSHADTLLLMDVLDRIRYAAGIKYDADHL
ncbi:MAG: Gfo/Idh/MocA family protein [Chitinophagaceae bacterium]